MEPYVTQEIELEEVVVSPVAGVRYCPVDQFSQARHGRRGPACDMGRCEEVAFVSPEKTPNQEFLAGLEVIIDRRRRELGLSSDISNACCTETSRKDRATRSLENALERRIAKAGRIAGPAGVEI